MESSSSSKVLPYQTVRTRYSGELRVFVQGDLGSRGGKVIFMTVHDVGSNHKSFMPFVEHPDMREVRRKTIWLHVCLPGQDDHEETLPPSFEYPCLDKLAHDLQYVLEAFNVRTVIGMGEGAGANILCRFSLCNPNRCLGLILIDSTCGTAGFDEYIKYTLFNWREGGTKLVDKMMQHVTQHKTDSRGTPWKGAMNAVNLTKYLDVYLKRTDISRFLTSQLKVEALVVAGSFSPYLPLCKEMVRHMDKLHTTLMVIDDVADPLFRAPVNLARALILFCKGCGVLIGIPMWGLENEFKRICEKQESSSAINKIQVSIAEAMLAKERSATCA